MNVMSSQSVCCMAGDTDLVLGAGFELAHLVSDVGEEVEAVLL